jgi:predicted  nucleic acid-binding Zn-ribbon protein
MGEERRIERLEFELAEAGTDILDLRKQLAEALADCAATSYKLSEAFDELVAYELQLADARAEIERRNNGHDLLFSTFSQLREMLKTELAERDKLIEQMREALTWALTEARSTHGEQLIKAALRAADGGK